MKRRKKKGKQSPALKRVLSTRKGRAAASRFRRFWGVPASEASKVALQVAGVPSSEPYVGLGISPMLYVADAPQQPCHIRRIRRRGILVSDASGRRMAILTGRTSSGRRRLKKLGWIPQTDYLPFSDVEKAGSHKKSTHWQHHHDEGGGKWPFAREDQFGNVWYDKGTYSVSDWIRK